MALTSTLASRESTTATNQPYLRVTYTIGQATNLTITARPLLSCEGGQIVVNVSANSSDLMRTLDDSRSEYRCLQCFAHPGQRPHSRQLH